ncbi:hypothetical protein [Streptomyces sp. NPDC102282]|uniref:hypothetical protein n=1 Tax=Streptomyces sp. NPDC102282 TaxID=3366154 RepID=UPI0038258941
MPTKRGLDVHRRLRYKLGRSADAFGYYLDGPRAFVMVGVAVQMFCVAAGVVYFWQQEMTFAGYALLQAAFLLCQAVSLAPALWGTLPDLHHNATLAVVCGTGVLMGPGLMALVLTGNGNGPPAAAVLLTGSALVLAGTVGLISGTFLSGWQGLVGAGSAGYGGDPDIGDFGSGDD